ncbi:hypothetical protein E2320_014371 [Naja naja]|nr:hypothetical protein E2320_014371 [Naja naja]
MEPGKHLDPLSDTSSTPKKPGSPHECSECGKSFAHRSLLLIHRKVHVGSGSSQGLEVALRPGEDRRWIPRDRLLDTARGRPPLLPGKSSPRQEEGSCGSRSSAYRLFLREILLRRCLPGADPSLPSRGAKGDGRKSARQQLPKKMEPGKLLDPPSVTSSTPNNQRTPEYSEGGKSFPLWCLVWTHQTVHVGSGSSQGLENDRRWIPRKRLLDPARRDHPPTPPGGRQLRIPLLGFPGFPRGDPPLALPAGTGSLPFLQRSKGGSVPGLDPKAAAKEKHEAWETLGSSVRHKQPSKNAQKNP